MTSDLVAGLVEGRDGNRFSVTDAIDPADLVTLEEKCQQIIDNKESMAFDWAWEADQSREERAFKILQSSPSMFWPDFADAPFRRWAVEFASALMGMTIEFWYDQFLAKPPEKSAPTRWHQDEGYWGRLVEDRGITCWMPFHDVDPDNGCMHFIGGGHKDGMLTHVTRPRCRATCSTANPTSRGRSPARCRWAG